MDDQHNNPEGFEPAPENYEPAPQNYEPSPFEQAAPVPPAPPAEDYTPSPEAMAAAGAAVGVASTRGFIGRAWRGEEKLWKVFWLYGVVGGIVLQTLITVLAGVGGMFLAIPGLILMLAFAVWNIVSVWRCAWNAKAKVWGYIVRVLCVLSGLSYVSTLLAVGGMMFVGSAVKSGAVNITPAAVTAPAVPGNAPSPAPAAPVAAPMPPMAAPAAPAPAYSPCEKQMADFALANGVDPKTYIAQNQAWLAQCNQAGGAH